MGEDGRQQLRQTINRWQSVLKMASFKVVRLADSERTMAVTRSAEVSTDAEFNSPSFDVKNGMIGQLRDKSMQ